MFHIHCVVCVLSTGCTVAAYVCIHGYTCVHIVHIILAICCTDSVCTHVHIVCICTHTSVHTACTHAHMYTVDHQKWMYNRLLCVYTCVQTCTCCVQLPACMCRTRLCLSCFRSASETACRDCLCVWANFPQAGAKIFRHASLSLLPGLLCIRDSSSRLRRNPSLAVVIYVL